MGVSTTHRINLSMWILIYSFSDTYYVWAACGGTLARPHELKIEKMASLPWFITDSYYFIVNVISIAFYYIFQWKSKDHHLHWEGMWYHFYENESYMILPSKND